MSMAGELSGRRPRLVRPLLDLNAIDTAPVCINYDRDWFDERPLLALP